MKEFDDIKSRTFPHDLQFHTLSANLGLDEVEDTFHQYMYEYEGDKSFYEYVDGFKFDKFEIPDNIHTMKISENTFFKENRLTPKSKELLKKYRKGSIWKDL
jgi:hypothetical protein